MMFGFMSLWMVVGLVVIIALVGGAAALAARVGRPHLSSGDDTRTLDDARTLLDRRLASGEITPEEYFERESALRSGEPRPSRRRH